MLVVGCVYIWLRQSKKASALSSGATSTGGEGRVDMPAYEPAVLVQIPMCNEKECYRQSISAACRLDWPQNNLVIQVSAPLACISYTVCLPGSKRAVC
jgi:hypothetical protein